MRVVVSSDAQGKLWYPRFSGLINVEESKQVLFDFTSQNWTELADVTGCYNRWSRDGKYVYFQRASEEAICRVRVSERALERVVTIRDMRRAQGVFAEWMGLSPGDSILLTREVGIQENLRLGRGLAMRAGVCSAALEVQTLRHFEIWRLQKACVPWAKVSRK